MHCHNDARIHEHYSNVITMNPARPQLGGFLLFKDKLRDCDVKFTRAKPHGLVKFLCFVVLCYASTLRHTLRGKASWAGKVFVFCRAMLCYALRTLREAKQGIA